MLPKKVNEVFFRHWSHDMAYVLGLWFAKGSIYRGEIFNITLPIKDKYILKKIKELLAYDKPITDSTNKQRVRIDFNSVVVCKNVESLINGNTIDFPYVPKSYLPDFIRGYFDGNGNIYNIQGKRINVVFTNESKRFLDSLLKILQAEAGVEGGSYDSSSLSLHFGKKDSIKIGKYIYSNNTELFLLRKRKKFDTFLLKEEI